MPRGHHGTANRDLPVLQSGMLKSRMKRLAAESARAITQVADIHASIVGLSDDDLLDLADIFCSGPATALKDMADAEMAKRNLTL